MKNKSEIRDKGLAEMRRFLFFVISILLISSSLFASEFTLCWEYENPPNDLKGFKIYCKYEGIMKTLSLEDLTARSFKFIDAGDGEYEIYMTAFDINGNESVNSETVNYLVDTPPLTPAKLKIPCI